MHELSIVQNIVQTSCEFLEENKIEHAKFVTLIVGQNTGVIAQYLRMYYDEVCVGTCLEGTELRVEEKPTEYFCRDCGNVFKTSLASHAHLMQVSCPSCNSKDLEVISGNELMIKEIGYE